MAMQKLVQLNIEGDAHISLVQEFLLEQNPDIVCLQEVYEKDMDELCALPHRAFLLTMRRTSLSGEVHTFGVALYSRAPILAVERIYYTQPKGVLGVFDRSSVETIRNTSQRGVLFCEIENGVCVASVHHTWTKDGLSDAYQRADTEALVNALSGKKPHILCGDFNIPRVHNDCYMKLLGAYEDCIPKDITCSLHVPLHRVRHDVIESQRVSQYMVDYIFRTKGAPNVTDVQQHCGMSDHCAFTALVH